MGSTPSEPVAGDAIVSMRKSAQRSSDAGGGRLAFASRAVRRDHLHSFASKLLIKRIAVVRAVADQVFRLRLDHVKVEGELHQRDFVMIGGMRRDRQR